MREIDSKGAAAEKIDQLLRKRPRQPFPVAHVHEQAKEHSRGQCKHRICVLHHPVPISSGSYGAVERKPHVEKHAQRKEQRGDEPATGQFPPILIEVISYKNVKHIWPVAYERQIVIGLLTHKACQIIEAYGEGDYHEESPFRRGIQMTAHNLIKGQNKINRNHGIEVPEMLLHRFKEYGHIIVRVHHKAIPYIVNQAPRYACDQKAQEPFCVLFKGLFPAEKEGAGEHKEAGHADSGDVVERHRENVLIEADLPVGAAIVICDMYQNHHHKGAHADKLQVVVFFRGIHFACLFPFFGRNIVQGYLYTEKSLLSTKIITG